MRTLDYKKYGKNHPLSLSIGLYSGHNLAIRLLTYEEGYPEPWSNLTVNLEIIGPKNTAFIDTNNNGEEIVKWIIDNNLGQLTGRLAGSGYCDYPEIEFFEEALKTFDEDGYNEYSDIYDICFN